MKVLVYIIMGLMFVSLIGLGYVDYKHFSNDYKLELKIKKANDRNIIMLNKINQFCFEFNKKGDVKSKKVKNLM